MLNLHYSVESLEILDADPNIVGTTKTLVRDLLALHEQFARVQEHSTSMSWELSPESMGR